jgi:putative permease
MKTLDLKRIAMIAAVVLLTLGSLGLAWRFANVIALVAVSLAVAAMTRAPIEWLINRRVRKSLAMAFVYGVGLLVLFAIIWYVGPRIFAEMQSLSLNLSAAYAAFESAWRAGSPLQQSVISRLPDAEQLNQLLLSGDAGLAQALMSATMNLVEIVTQSLLVIVISLYWSADNLHFERLMLSMVPATQRGRVRLTWREMEKGIGAYLRSEIAQCLIAGVVLAIGFSAMGVSYPLTRAVLAAVAWLLPLVGGAVALIPVWFFGLFINPAVAAAATLFMFAVFAFLEFVVERRLYPRERYGSVLVLLVTIAMVEALGIVGLLIAPPLAAALQIALTEWLRPAPAVVQSAVAGTSLATMKAQLAEAQLTLEEQEQPSPRTKNLLDRMRALIASVEESGHLAELK